MNTEFKDWPDRNQASTPLLLNASEVEAWRGASVFLHLWCLTAPQGIVRSGFICVEEGINVVEIILRLKLKVSLEHSDGMLVDHLVMVHLKLL